MYKLLSWYNRNRKEIWGILIAIIIIVALFYYILEQFTESSNSGSSVVSNDSENISDTLNSVTLTTEDSVISGTTATTSSEKIEVIDKFIEYCNDQDIEAAYELLSEDCKDELYQTLESFETSYYDNIFGGTKKSVSMENWVDDTYKVDLSDDFLETGVYSTDTVTQDYITIVKDDDEYKLNINGYIKRKTSTYTGQNSELTVNITEINTYMDYETYTFEITNNSEYTAIMSDLSTLDSVYLVDSNGNEYNAYLHELSSAQVSVAPGQTKSVTIKFYNKFSSSKTIERVIFDSIEFEADTSFTDILEIEL